MKTRWTEQEWLATRIRRRCVVDSITRLSKFLPAMLCLLVSASFLPAGQIVKFEAVGAQMEVPDDFQIDASDRFGTVLRPEGAKSQKVRVHLTSQKNVTPSEAIIRGSETVDEWRQKKKLPPEKILPRESLTTRSGLRGEAAVVGWERSPDAPYLTRCYFPNADGRIFCVCIYHWGEEDFIRTMMRDVLPTLRWIPSNDPSSTK